MDQVKVFAFVEQNKEFLFPNEICSEMDVENALLEAPDHVGLPAGNNAFRSPSTFQLISIFLGPLGIDRLYLGEFGKAFLKYITFGGLGIWWIADMISAKKRCRTYNCKKLLTAVQSPSSFAQTGDFDSKLDNILASAKNIAPAAKKLAQSAKNFTDSFDD